MGRAFQRAIAEKPDDDTPRLIYADWLEENGWPEQAEFIRLDIELAAAGAGEGGSGRRRRDRRWKHREQLLDAHRAAWLWPLGDLLDGGRRPPTFRYVRGFAAELSIAPPLFVENAAAICAFQPITRVRLMVGNHPLGTWAYGVLYDQDLTGSGVGRQRIPGRLFPFLSDLGLEIQVRGARAEFPLGVGGEEVVSRAAVAFGRHEAGLPPLTWS
jgi:uncharacterized protein (TIGR02996 family)